LENCKARKEGRKGKKEVMGSKKAFIFLYVLSLKVSKLSRNFSSEQTLQLFIQPT